MKIDFKKIIEIKTNTDLNKFKIDEPLYYNNYLFHYLIIFNKLDILKLTTFPIYKENDDGMNGFFLAAKYNNLSILKYLLKNYPEYIYNRNSKDEVFTDYFDFSNIVKLIDSDLKWDLLLNNKIDELFYNLNYDELLILFKTYKPTNHYLHYIILNPNLSVKQIISILKMFEKLLKLRDIQDESLIFPAIHKKDIELVKYLLINNVDHNYYTIMYTYNPLKTALNINFLDAANLIWNKIKNNFDYELTNRNLENIAHFLLKRKIIDKLASEILLNCPSNVWSQLDIYKLTPLELLINYDFNKYNYLIKNKSIKIDLLNKINYDNENTKLWMKLLKTLPVLKDDNNVVLQKNSYSHANLFKATFKDMSFYLLHLTNKYKNLYFPNINDQQIANLNSLDDILIEWPDPMLEDYNIFPWIICYENDDNYWIHNQLNNLINIQRRKKKYDFGFCYLSLRTIDYGLHANILIYDFNNFTVERFDPYGDSVNFDKKLDEILEEELTWNTGLKYLKPSDYMPVAGFQTVSDELNPLKQKSGDFGGYCLAWCTWYLEHRLINKNINPKELVNKLLKKLSLDDNSFIENIRNYANKLNDSRVAYLKKAGIDTKTISNINYSNNVDSKLTNYIVNQLKFYKN
jgi:hypothetical protein